MERTPSPTVDDPRPRCTKCGYVAYQQVGMGFAVEWRCFPHAKPAQGRMRIRERLKTEERYKLDHIDNGFPADEAYNDARENAFGAVLLDPLPARRAGLER